ncbi:nucleotidyl transferase AbiEii/AbiGii toxin family protein [Exilibacterium tricleocarpae]|uniref:Nucleotidyl transferase AbiEii/AbiGii toxin family protein n=1 Tax=Exilibacterium tricleocarpae TaxID=2591008 RepID=A0A545U5J7_9GAMM|nr:nucleotidyl transferase AbiEii/AbiGii toxin family protein [Exilibacterium tricleocarpae]TQV84739.1 nucleotidyl transferase AbiEii/AbiGii toxin family protein [Exilibacterium tricleocarpae]
MKPSEYKEQVGLLLQVLPYVAEEGIFALKGGTAINLFHRDFPRLSVDIDLTYLPKEDRKTAMKGISDGLGRIQKALEGAIQGIRVTKLPQSDGAEAKLLCQLGRTDIKVEVNTTLRGYLWEPVEMAVVDAVQDEFERFAAIRIVSKGELYGGKICAALDRQHPRDLFDIKILLDEEGITEQVRLGFIASLLGSNKPLHELLQPNLKDQRAAFKTKFEGMATRPFTYEDFETTRENLVSRVNDRLSDRDKEFFISFTTGDPDWSICPVNGLESMPAIQWKLHNLRKLKEKNPAKRSDLQKRLIKCLGGNKS